LSALNFNQLYIPAGFAHGFLTLEDDCEVVYKVSSPYNHESDVSISAFDEDFQIELPCPNSEIIFSEKDANGQSWRSVGEIF
jgi:dTDP-4-dehydrorhamnose 3,5-epimerase